MAKNECEISNKIKKRSTKVEVTFPALIQVDLVQGNELKQYEIFFAISSLSLSTAVSFWTSYSVDSNNTLRFSALAFSLLTLLTAIIAIYYRSKVYNTKIKRTASLDNFNK